MWDERGFFYYRVLRFGTIRTSYMRWSQAWMLLALATLLADERPRRAITSSLRAGAGVMRMRPRPATADLASDAARFTYVLITPARNEAEFIELTIASVVAQTIRPARWVIVSDGSTDGTDEIVSGYAARHPWIELVRMPERAPNVISPGRSTRSTPAWRPCAASTTT